MFNYYFNSMSNLFSIKLEILHNNIMFVMIYICVFILFFFYKIVKNKKINLFFIENYNLELYWTLLPIFILLIICLSSLNLLYFSNIIHNPFYNIIVIGNQWYWEYNINFFDNRIDYLSYLSVLKTGDLSGFEVDKFIFLPVNIPILFLFTSSDVIHSYSIPELSLKVDCIPGRLNSLIVNTFRVGKYFGQCSELCGINHSFMPCCVFVYDLL